MRVHKTGPDKSISVTLLPPNICQTLHLRLSLSSSSTTITLRQRLNIGNVGKVGCYTHCLLLCAMHAITTITLYLKITTSTCQRQGFNLGLPGDNLPPDHLSHMIVSSLDSNNVTNIPYVLGVGLGK